LVIRFILQLDQLLVQLSTVTRAKCKMGVGAARWEGWSQATQSTVPPC